MTEFEIRVLGDDEIITEDGFYQLPLERHHSQPCDGPSVTSGVLRRMEMETPADVWAFHQLNPDRWDSIDTPAMKLGRAMAALVEGGLDELKRFFMVLSATKPNRPTEAQLLAYENGSATTAGIRSVEYWARVEADGREVLTRDEYMLLANMGSVLMKDPAARAALSGTPELTMAWRDQATGLWCLSRPDNTGFSGIIADYKKVNTSGRPFNASVCDRKTTDGGYDMQMAFASEGFHHLTGEWPQSVGLIFQTDKPPHHVIPLPIEEEDLTIAMFRNDRSRKLFAECLESGDWWGPSQHIVSYRRPEWQRKKLLEEMQIAGVAL